MNDVSPTALVFPGQGSQRPGMAEPWRDHPAFARWAEADETLHDDLTHLGLHADADELRRPRACQLALFVHGVVLFEAWYAATGRQPRLVAGHSLGEYVALVAAGAVEFDDALRLVDVRARACEAAADADPGGMVACLGMELATIEDACARAGAHVANDNAPGQVVVAGRNEALDTVKDILGEAGGKIRDVDVGAPYHTPHMQPAVEALRQQLALTAFADTGVPVVANVDAKLHTDGAGWVDRLAQQVVSPVRWRESVEQLATEGVEAVVELGASAPLSGMIKRTDRGLARQAVHAPDDLAA